MELHQLRSFFKQELGNLYEPTETTALYYTILQEILQCKNKTDLLLHGDALLTSEKETEFKRIVTRLKKGEPIQYILGHCIFCNLTLTVTPDVLIPRPETEELVRWIINDCSSPSQILDIGTGSGCIAIALKKGYSNSEIYALDISSDSLKIAQQNAQLNNVDIHFIEDNILTPSYPHQTYDLIVSNPPYIMEREKNEMHINVLDHEPHRALFVDNENPLLFYEKIAIFGKKHLTKGGFIYFEINEKLSNETKQLLTKYNYQDIVIKKDDNNKNRMIKCRKR